MIIEDWVSDIIHRWPYRNNKTEGEIKAIADDLTSFATGRLMRDLEPILIEFKSMKPPKGFGMWWFWERVKSNGSGLTWWRVCECGQRYKDIGSSCPVCGSNTFMLDNGSVMPQDTILIQSSCCKCSRYAEDREGSAIGIYGPSCNEYGTEKRMKQNICKDCKCQDCCTMAYEYKNNPAMYRKRMGDYIDNKFKEVMNILENGVKNE